MMNNFLAKARVVSLIALLNENLHGKMLSMLISENQKITYDNIRDINKDVSFLKKYLRGYIKEHFEPFHPKQLKSKGKVLIMLSYNEPFIMSVVPILNALVAGNEVYVRPSTKNKKFIQAMWGTVLASKKYPLHIIENDITSTYQLIESMNGVYFFGSEANAKKVAIKCAESLIEFHPQIETADFAVVDTLPMSLIKPIALKILDDSFSHRGQRCQRIQGVYIKSSLLKSFKHALILASESSQYEDITTEFGTVEQRHALYTEIRKSQPKEQLQLGKNKLPSIIFYPKPKSNFVNSAYFLPVFWVISYKTKAELLKLLQTRKYFLGINYWGHDDKFLKKLIAKTRHTRFTLNTNHANIRTVEGWGGASPSGYGGYQSWLEKFTNPYCIIY